MSKPKHVKYQRSLICHLDILGFRRLVSDKKPGEISKVLRLFSDAVSPKKLDFRVDKLDKEQFVAFSDLHITVIPTEPNNGFAHGLMFMEVLRLLHAQWILFFDHAIVVRGGIVVGEAVRSYGRFFGQGIIDAYDVESKRALYPRIVVDASVFDEIKRNPQVWTHEDADTELRAVKGLLHHDQENGVFYIDYLRVTEGEFDFPEIYGDYLSTFRTKVDAMLAETRDAGDRSKLEWMQRYHKRTEKALRSRKGPLRARSD